MPVQTGSRGAVAVEYTWNAESVFKNRAAWSEELRDLNKALPKLEKHKGSIGASAEALIAFIDLYLPLRQRTDKIMFYAIMLRECDANDSEASAMVSQALALHSALSTAAAFMEPELLAVGRDKLTEWLSGEKKLRLYQQYAENLFRRAEHVRSTEVEEVLGLASEPLGSVDDVASALTNADMRFVPAAGMNGKIVEITQGSIHRLLSDPDRDLRQTAWERYSDGYVQNKNTLSANLMVAVKRDVFISRVRRHASALEAALHPDNIAPTVFHSLIETFKKHLPTWHRYWAIRRRALALETLHPWDTWAPLTRKPPVVAYKQAVEWISEAMKPLGKDYAKTLRKGCLEERWVDVYPTKGKRQGAFSWGVQGTHPFIMMSYNDTLSDMSTLAHELGHSMHSYLTWQTQPYVYSTYSIFAAEVASNFNQAMTRAYLMREKADDKTFQIALLEEAMYNFHRYFFQMPILARFELEIHQRAERGEGVTADDMTALMADLLAEGYGGEMNMSGVTRDRVGVMWAKFAHLYSNFYVFQYATGISAAHALSSAILSGADGAVERYLTFLSAGSSAYPVDALKAAGVDLTTAAPVEKTFEIMSGYVDKLAQLTEVY
jgi:oligoendopeptidase F